MIPANYGLQAIIEAKKLYPVTLLKALDSRTRRKLDSAGIVLLSARAEISEI